MFLLVLFDERSETVGGGGGWDDCKSVVDRRHFDKGAAPTAVAAHKVLAMILASLGECANLVTVPRTGARADKAKCVDRERILHWTFHHGTRFSQPSKLATRKWSAKNVLLGQRLI